MTATALKKPAPRQVQKVDQRARLVKLVHVGRRELGLADEDYRTILRKQGGAESAGDMNATQLQRVVDFMRAQGFKVANKAKSGSAARPVKLASDPGSRKARAMWLTLHAIGQVRDPSEQALQAYAKRQCGVARLEWVQDPIPLIESLKAWLLRSLPGVVTPYLKTPVASWAGHMGAAWHENFDRALINLRHGLQEGRRQLVDEWVAVWELISSATDGAKQ